MPYVEQIIAAGDGSRLYVRRSEVEKSRGEVIIAHGFGEHSGRYGPITQHLLSQSYCVTAYDQRGHGQSDGLPGHIKRFSDYEDDLDCIVSFVASRGEGNNIFIIGHSMGDLITLWRGQVNFPTD